MTGLILVIDDSKNARSAHKMLLSLLGFDVVEAGDGQEGLELLMSSPGRFSAIILDEDMPRMTGQQLLQYLKENPPTPPVPPIIYVSGSINQPKVAKLFGLTYVVEKNEKPEVYLNILKKALRVA